MARPFWYELSAMCLSRCPAGDRDIVDGALHRAGSMWQGAA